jgi:hypothetical protein
LKKTKQLLIGITEQERGCLQIYGKKGVFLTSDARCAATIPDGTVQLTVMSSPFLDVVQYFADNWLRCWFNGIDAAEIEKRITMSRTVKQWGKIMENVFQELYRITKPGGWVAFEVGEIRNSSIKFDEVIVPLGVNVGFSAVGILINNQKFSKTSNIWGIHNNVRGTNSNRVVLFSKAME